QEVEEGEGGVPIAVGAGVERGEGVLEAEEVEESERAIAVAVGVTGRRRAPVIRKEGINVTREVPAGDNDAACESCHRTDVVVHVAAHRNPCFPVPDAGMPPTARDDLAAGK